MRRYSSRVAYTGYKDLKDPIVAVSESGDLGWIAVNPLAEGQSVESGAPFRLQWVWVILARKVEAVWMHAGNASNMKISAG